MLLALLHPQVLDAQPVTDDERVASADVNLDQFSSKPTASPPVLLSRSGSTGSISNAVAGLGSSTGPMTRRASGPAVPAGLPSGRGGQHNRRTGQTVRLKKEVPRQGSVTGGSGTGMAERLLWVCCHMGDVGREYAFSSNTTLARLDTHLLHAHGLLMQVWGQIDSCKIFMTFANANCIPMIMSPGVAKIPNA